MQQYADIIDSKTSTMSTEYIGEFDNIYSMLTSLMESLLVRFKQDTGYKQPLIAPQGNIIYAIDATVAQNIINYFSQTLVKSMDFTPDEFVFTRKSSQDGSLQRIRLEFTNGISGKTIKKIMHSMEDARNISN